MTDRRPPHLRYGSRTPEITSLNSSNNGLRASNGGTSSLSLDFVVKIENLEREQASMRSDLAVLKSSNEALTAKVQELLKGGWDVTVGPFQSQSVSEFRSEFEALRSEAQAITNSSPSKHTNGLVDSQPDGEADKRSALVDRAHSLVETNHRSAFSTRSERSYASGVNSPLVTDGQVDNLTDSIAKLSDSESTPPASPHSTLRANDVTDESLVTKTWKPDYVNTLQALASEKQALIPKLEDMMSFSHDFLLNHLGGITWSPGTMIVPPDQPAPHFLRNRIYYLADAYLDPHLPSLPGEHGARLVPFFNADPEDEMDFEDEFSSSERIPMFVLKEVPDAAGRPRKRYYYYGHYSQTRWSDRLDCDRIRQHVPSHVLDFWAEELSSNGRPAWLTDALEKHFFPKPEYDGQVFGTHAEEGGSVVSEDVGKREEQVLKDMKRYMQQLKRWEKDAKLKTSLIKKDFVLDAFQQVSCPPDFFRSPEGEDIWLTL